MSNPVFWENKKKYHQFVIRWISQESGKEKNADYA